MNQPDYQWARSYLYNNEQILWRGKPDKLHVFEEIDLTFLLFGAFWTCLVLFKFAIPSFRSKPFGLTWLMPMFFLLVGFYFSIGHLLQKAVCLRASSYVVTNSRILIQVGGRVHQYSKANLPPIIVTRYADGEGSIILQYAQSYHPRRTTYPMFADMRNAIHSIPDVDAALRAINTDRL